MNERFLLVCKKKKDLLGFKNPLPPGEHIAVRQENPMGVPGRPWLFIPGLGEGASEAYLRSRDLPIMGDDRLEIRPL